jgi:hypothetical protein
MDRRIDLGSGYGPWGTISEQNARPFQHLTFTDSTGGVGGGLGDDFVQWRFVTRTSDGTDGAPLTMTAVVSDA